MIKVALVDDHPAVRAGLHALLRREPGLTPVAVPVLEELAPRDVLAAESDVALVDGQLAVGTGLGLCFEMSRLAAAPPIVLYSAYLDQELAIAARVSGAAGVLNKSEPLERLLNALRVVARGEALFPPIVPGALRHCADLLEPEDLPLLSMLAHGTTRWETAQTLGVTHGALEARLARVVATLERCLLPPGRGALRVA
jgi:DNA-binding NarL/FixJ family response regulator